MTKASKTRVERKKRGAKVVHSLHVPDIQIELSNPAALRAFHKLSADGQAMLMAMIRWVSKPEHIDNDSPVLRKASEDVGLPSEDVGLPEWRARSGVGELLDTGLLRRTKQDAMELHPMFSVIGHRLRREGQTDTRTDAIGDAIGNVVAFN